MLCNKCGATIDHECEASKPVDSTTQPCTLREGAIWVNVRNEDKRGVEGISVKVGSKTTDTSKKGFAVFDPLEPKTYNVELQDVPQSLRDQYALPIARTIAAPVARGVVSYVSFTLRPTVKPVVTASRAAVAVNGDRLTVKLTADRSFSGNGVLTVAKGGAKVHVYRQGSSDALDDETRFENITETGATVEVEAVEPSKLKGVELRWTLESDTASPGPAAVLELTVVKATLEIHHADDKALTPDEKTGDGRVVHLQREPGQRSRAKIQLSCDPSDYEGELRLAAIKANLTVFDAAEGGTEVDLGKGFAVGSGKTLDPLYVEGKTVSDAKADTGLRLAITDLGDDVDAAKMTVVDVRLVVYAERPDPKTEPVALSDKDKMRPGRKLYKQGKKQFICERAKLRVTKKPADAPCSLELRTSGDGAVRLFPEVAKNKQDKMVSLEEHIENEAEVKLPKKIAPDEITDPDAGLVFWVEGAEVSVGKVTLGQHREKIEAALLHLDVVDVDQGCDEAAFVVDQPKIVVEIARADAKTLSAALQLALDGPEKPNLTIPIGGKLIVPVDAGEYKLALTPGGSEAGYGIMRLEPDDSNATVRASGPPRTVKLQLEPAPVYTKIQPIAYRIRTGEYLGTDIPGNFGDDKKKAALHDIEERCKIMVNAVVKAAERTEIDPDPAVLKVFIAPEFYFRGRQGAYPIDTIHKIMKHLRTEADKAKYKDWLFVFGSALGYLAGPGRGPESAGTLVTANPEVAINVHVDKAGPAAQVGPGWHLWVCESDGTTWKPVTGSTAAPITTSTPLGSNQTRSFFELELTRDLVFNHRRKLGLMPPDVKLANNEKLTRAQVATAGPVADNWHFIQGGHVRAVIRAFPAGPNKFELVIAIPLDTDVVVGAAQVSDGTTSYAAQVQSTSRGLVLVLLTPGSAAAAVATGWSFSGTVGGQWCAPIQITNVYPNGPNKALLELASVPSLETGSTVAAWDGAAVPYEATIYKQQKVARVKMNVPGDPVIDTGWFASCQGADAVVVANPSKAGDDYGVALGLHTDAQLQINTPVKVFEPGETEVFNLALLRKGGAGTPTASDGSTKLKELLVYKESISSVDFLGMDYGTHLFYSMERKLAELHGDTARRLVPSEGASGSAKENKSGDTYQWTDTRTNTTHTARITEINRSGLGGGSIFEMHGITFGVEVCLDHGNGRLKDYFANHAQTGETKVQVQLIPSCGMSIKNPACVAQGIVFNVDAWHHAVKDQGGTHDVTKGPEQAVPATPGVTQGDYFSQEGEIAVYAALPLPPAETV